MDIIRAKEIVRGLAEGVDPTTGEVLPAESVYNSPEVIRALFTVLEYVNSDMVRVDKAVKASDFSDDFGRAEDFLFGYCASIIFCF